MKIVYTDLEGVAPRVKWQGVSFLDGVQVEVPIGFDTSKIAGNPFFAILPDSAPETADHGEPERRGPGRPPKIG